MLWLFGLLSKEFIGHDILFILVLSIILTAHNVFKTKRNSMAW